MIISGGLVVASIDPIMIFEGSIVVEGGIIIELLPGRQYPTASNDTVIDARGSVVMPGLINSHTHSGVTVLRGLFEEQTLLEMNLNADLERMMAYLRQDHTAQLLCCETTYLECLKRGTTFVCDVPPLSHGPDIINIFRTIGVRGAVIENPESDFTYLRNQCAALQSANLQVYLWVQNEAITQSRSKFTSEHLATIKERINELDTGIYMHLAETQWRVQSVKERFMGLSTLEVLDQWNLLNDRFVGVHAVHLDSNDIRLLQKTGAAIVACPTAEMKLADGIAPIPLLMQAGVPIGLGTDGAIYNNTNDLFMEMKVFCLLHKLAFGPASVTAIDALRAATSAGAQIFGLHNQIGSLLPGRYADIILLDATDVAMLPLLHHSVSNVLSNLVFAGSGHLVKMVFIGGEMVINEGKHIDINEAFLRKRVMEMALDYSSLLANSC